MRKSVAKAMSLNLTPRDYMILLESSLGAKNYPPDIIKDVVRWGLTKREQKQEEPIPCLMEES